MPWAQTRDVPQGTWLSTHVEVAVGATAGDSGLLLKHPFSVCAQTAGKALPQSDPRAGSHAVQEEARPHRQPLGGTTDSLARRGLEGCCSCDSRGPEASPPQGHPANLQEARSPHPRSSMHTLP